MFIPSIASRSLGIGLVEAMVALVIVSFGLLAVARLHGDLIAGSATSKARTEAVQLAQTQIENRRTEVLQSQCNGLLGQDGAAVSHQSTHTGTNASFNVSITVSAINNNPEHLNVNVAVTWRDAKMDQNATPHTLVMRSDVVCDRPGDSANVAIGSLPDGGLVDTPTGLAYMGEGSYTPEQMTEIKNKPGTITNKVGGINDGTYTHFREDGKVELIGEDGIVIMTMKGSTANQGFSTINGKIYIDKDHSLGTGNNDVDSSKVLALSSDASHCTRVFKGGSDFGTGVLTNEGTVVKPENFNYELFGTSTDPYWHYLYQCYLGEGWYGNIGILRTDSAANSHRICVGDPGISPSTSWSNRHPKLTVRRQYRGYEQVQRNGRTVNEARGIGINLDYGVENEESEEVTARYTAVHYDNHHFLLTPISGNPNDADCKTKLEKNGNTLFAGNLGYSVCLTPSCPGESGSTEGPKTLLSGRIDRLSSGGNRPDLAGILIDGGVCVITITHNNYFGYQCEIGRAGWTGSTWSGAMTLETSNTLCTAAPTGTAKDYVTIDSTNKRLSFADAPLATEDGEDLELTLSFKLGFSETECGMPITAPDILISGRIDRGNQGSNRPRIANLSLRGVSCTITDTQNTHFLYQCALSREGLTNPWSGDLLIDFVYSTNALCSTTLTGTGAGYATIVPADNKLTLSNVPLPATGDNLSRVINFKVGHTATQCN